MTRDGDWLVGYGCAAASYPTNVAPAAARLSLTPEGKATIGLAGHEIGTGAYTTVAITVAGSLGIDVKDVTVRLGDSDFPARDARGRLQQCRKHDAGGLVKACVRRPPSAALPSSRPFWPGTARSTALTRRP